MAQELEDEARAAWEEAQVGGCAGGLGGWVWVGVCTVCICVYVYVGECANASMSAKAAPCLDKSNVSTMLQCQP